LVQPALNETSSSWAGSTSRTSNPAWCAGAACRCPGFRRL